MIVPDLGLGDGSDTFFGFIPQNTVLAVKDFLWLRERMQVIYEEAVAPQALIAQEGGSAPMRLENKLIDGSEFVTRALDFRRLEFGSKPTGTPDASLQFAVTPQPVS